MNSSYVESADEPAARFDTVVSIAREPRPRNSGRLIGHYLVIDAYHSGAADQPDRLEAVRSPESLRPILRISAGALWPFSNGSQDGHNVGDQSLRLILNGQCAVCHPQSMNQTA